MAKSRKDKKRKKNIPLLIGAAALIVLLTAVLVVFSKNTSTMLGDRTTMPEVNYETSSKAAFYSSGKSIFYCTKDGMQLLDKQGSKLWTDTYTMQQPVLMGAGGYAAVAEERGKTVRVYDTSGLVYTINAENPITTFSVNREGYAAVIMELPNEYLTNIYNTMGAVVSVSSCPASESIPVAIAMSADSNIYATSYIDTSTVTFRSSVVMRYISKSSADAETIDGMFTAFSGGSGIVGRLNFFGTNSIAALSDSELIYVDISADSGGCVEKLRLPIDGIMTAVDFDENGNSAIAVRKVGEGVTGRISCYNKDGKETAAFDIEEEASALKFGSGLVIAASSSGLIAYDMNGGVLWRVTTGQDIKQMFMHSADELVIVGTNRMRVVRVKKGDVISDGHEAEAEAEGGAVEIVTENAAETVTENTVQTTAETTTAAPAAEAEDEDADSGSDEDSYSDYDEDEDEDYDYDEDEDEDYDYDEDYDEDEDEDYNYDEDEDYDYSEDEVD